MRKEKIAISINSRLLKLVDSKIDGTTLRSRSQAIEYFLVKGMEEQDVSKAVIMIAGAHQKTALTNVKGKPLLKHHLESLLKADILDVIILTQKGDFNDKLREIAEKFPMNIEFIENSAKTSGHALYGIKNRLHGADFVLIQGDTYNEINIKEMIQKHVKRSPMITIALMTVGEPDRYGTAVLDDDMVVDFSEKPKSPNSYIINAGIYIFSGKIFEKEPNIQSLEKELFPKLAKKRQILGFFSRGEFIHSPV